MAEARGGPVAGHGGLQAAGSSGGGAAELAPRVDLIEVGLRDGLQNQAVTLSTPDKLRLLDGLVASGLREVQLASFVHPQRVPQMADAEALCAAALERYGSGQAPQGLNRGAMAVAGESARPHVIFSGLALNRKGVERAAAAGLKHVDLSLSASDSHSRRNAGMGLAEAERHLLDTIAVAHDLGLSVRGGVQCAFGCGGSTTGATSGAISGATSGTSSGEPADEHYYDEVVRLAARIAGAGVRELALADSAGLADPLAVERLLHRVREAVGELPLVLHLHDTRGLGLANLYAALRLGVTRFDTSFGGLGGCPFIPGATGNVATEDVANMLAVMRIETGVDVDGVCQVSDTAADLLNAEMPSAIYGLWRRAQVGEAQRA